jgi:hypothetical protein
MSRVLSSPAAHHAWRLRGLGSSSVCPAESWDNCAPEFRTRKAQSNQVPGFGAKLLDTGEKVA